MSNISKEKVEHIAKLARIELTEQEKEKFSKELSSILDYVAQLNKVDTKNVKPIIQVAGLENVMREDEKRKEKKEEKDRLLKEAPQKKGDYIKVPKILE